MKGFTVGRLLGSSVGYSVGKLLGYSVGKLLGYSVGNFRSYSSASVEKRNKNVLGNILNSLFINNINKEYLSNEESQRAIEELVFNHYDLLFRNFKGYVIGGINTNIFSNKLNTYLLDKRPELVNNINNYKEYIINSKFILSTDKDIAPIISDIDVDFLVNLCIRYFLIISSYQNSNEKDKIYSINVALNIGKEMLSRYLFYLKSKDINFKTATYSD
jgi:hypothetical protein